MKRFRQRRPLSLLLLLVFISGAIGAAMSTPQPARSFFGFSQIALPLITKSFAPPPAPPKIVVWLDVPGKVDRNDRLQVIVNVQNQGGSNFDGRITITLPYDRYRFVAVESSFDGARGDWLKYNRFPYDLQIEFGSLRTGERRRGIVYFDLDSNGANAQIGDRLHIQATYNNGLPACGQDTCSTNKRTVEVTDPFTGGGTGTLPPGSRVVQKLGSINANSSRRWTPEGFRPGEEVVTWLNSTSGSPRPLGLQQTADNKGNVHFSIDTSGLGNGFYSIVAHGKDTKIEIVGEFQIVGAYFSSAMRIGAPVLLPIPPDTAATDELDVPASIALPQAGDTLLTGVVAAAGTSGNTRLEGVQINVIDQDGATVRATATDTFGGYLIGGLSAGTYTITIDPHFSLSDTTRRYQPQTLTSFSIPASGTVRLDAELNPGSSISGLVTGSGTGGLEGVSVVLISGTTVIEAVTTTADGRYTLDGVPSGSGYVLSFDPATAENPAVRAFDRRELSGINVSAPTPLSGRHITLDRNTATVEIAGQVAAADTGSPLAGVFVIFARQAGSDYEYAGRALTDANGNYSSVLPPGTYRISFEPDFAFAPDSARYLSEYFNDRSTPTGADTLTLSGGQIGRADAALARGGTIAGTVIGTDGPLADVAVLVYSGTTLVDIERTDADGVYRTAGLPNGSYQLEFATYLGTDAATQTYAGLVRAEPVTVNGTDVAGIDAQLTQGGRISGIVTGTCTTPLPGVLVLVVDTQNTPAADDDTLAGLTLTGDDGVYTSTGLLTGTYVVAFITELAGSPDVLAYFDEYYNDAANLTAADPVIVTSGAVTPNIDAMLTQGGQIRGRVTDDSTGDGIAGVFVEVYAATDPSTLVAFGVTDEAGDYATTVLSTGVDYLVRFNPVSGGGAGKYTAEFYDNKADTPVGATTVAVSSTTPVENVNAGLALAP